MLPQHQISSLCGSLPQRNALVVIDPAGSPLCNWAVLPDKANFGSRVYRWIMHKDKSSKFDFSWTWWLPRPWILFTSYNLQFLGSFCLNWIIYSVRPSQYIHADLVNCCGHTLQEWCVFGVMKCVQMPILSDWRHLLSISLDAWSMPLAGIHMREVSPQLTVGSYFKHRLALMMYE